MTSYATRHPVRDRNPRAVQPVTTGRGAYFTHIGRRASRGFVPVDAGASFFSRSR